MALPELSRPLYDVTFVVLDLETTGGSPQTCRITEVGAVKVRHGERLGELATLVNPGQEIPLEITALTGITNAMTDVHPPIEAVLPMLLEFLDGAVLVAHNARFDTGFLNAALERLGYPRLANRVVCTASLARRLLQDELPNCRLATLARYLRARTQPTHRALVDARATVDVLHALLERAGSFGVGTVEDLLDFARARNTPLFRMRAPLANGLPRRPGVYAFVAESGEHLYVGKATDLRARVRTYFGGDDRRWVSDMVRDTATVLHWTTPTPIEAEVRELRLIHEHRPRYNRRSRNPEQAVWVKLTPERFPRLALVRRPRDDAAAYLGPLHSRRTAEQVVEALQEVSPIRRCTDRIGPRTRFPPCALAEMGRCAAPCDGRITPSAYAAAIAPVRAAFDRDPTALVERLRERMERHAHEGRFEAAARVRDRLRALVTAVARSRRLDWIATAGPLVAVRTTRGACQVLATRSGTLVATAEVGEHEVEPVADEFLTRMAFGSPPLPSSPDERDLVARWLERPGTRIVRCPGVLAQPLTGGAVVAAELDRLRAASRATGRPASELRDRRLRRDRTVA